MRMRFAGCEIDLDRHLFLSGGEVVRLEPQVYDLVVLLARNPGRLVTREEVIETVWDGRVVSDSTIDARVAAARRALGDDGRQQSVIATVPRRGLRFLAEVEVADREAGETAAAGREPLVPDGRSIAVLPFDDLSDPSGQSLFADGVVDDIITELCRYPDLRVIARHSSFAFRDQQIDARRAGEALDVRFVLEGGIQRAADRLRITVRLIDAASGAQSWAERYDRDIADVFALQTEIAQLVAGTVGASLHDIEQSRLVSADPATLGAYELTQRAWAKILSTDRGALAEARELAHQAISLDPAYGRPWAMVAWTYVQDRFNGYAEDLDLWAERAFEASSKAVALDGQDPYASVAFAMALLHLRQHERALAELDRSIRLCPSYAELHAQRGNVLGFMARTVEAVESADEALRLNPRGPGHHHLMRGRALLVTEDNDEARRSLETAAALRPQMPQIHFSLAVAYARLGRPEDARREVAEILERSPDITRRYQEQMLPYLRPRDLAAQLDILTGLGLPD
ncbi:winged helix-turn-helix domain-containing tetratricopeptide repeat protein [Seohaeicola saemankumensis]|uniref:Winged helix-turn-helix domain-containing tetratricopeptide repeat protein n=1 Tax=Seohaeicola saemankumensis TaxID=481181 RepID=A0ABW3TIF5_9RHOB